MAVLVFDLGGTKLASALSDPDGNLHHNMLRHLEGRTGDTVGRLITEQISVHKQQAKAEGLSINGVGVSVPGISYTGTGKVWAPNIPGWEEYPLARTMRNALSENVPIVIESDRSCFVQGEVWKGSAQGHRNVVFLAVGTGIGLGILADGRIIRGGHDISGAIGWLGLQRPFEEKYVSCGCFEHHASGEGIAKVAREKLAEEPLYAGYLSEKAPASLTAHDVFDAAERGDSLAIAVIRNAIEMWGMATANCVSLFNPEKVIFGGGVFGPAVRFIPAIYEEARRWAQPISIRQVEFVPSALGSDAALLGAAFFAFEAQQ